MILTAKTIAPEERERLTTDFTHLAAKASFSRAGFIKLVRRFPGDRAA